MPEGTNPAAITTPAGDGTTPETVGQNAAATSGQVPGGANGDTNDRNEGGQTGGAPAAATTYDAAYVKQLRDEAASRRKNEAALTAKLKALEDAQLSEAEKLKKQLAETQAALAAAATETRKASAITQAAKSGARHPEVIAALVPADATDIVAAVEVIKKQYPTYFGPAAQGSADGGAGNTPGSGQSPASAFSMNDRIRALAGIPTNRASGL